MSKLNVAILVTVPRPELFDNCTLVFKTLRTGFPTAHVEVYNNSRIPSVGHDYNIQDAARKANCNYFTDIFAQHHADWIKDMVEGHDGHLVILDPDIIFWSNCEDFRFDSLIAGHHVPCIYNEFSRTISYDRLHTSFLWINDCTKLRQSLKMCYAPAHDINGDYCPCNPYAPDVKFVKGVPMFFDTCCNLYNMIGGDHFTECELERYTHVNSASFYDVMLQRVTDKKSFQEQHRLAIEEPKKLKGFWRAEDRYYQEMHTKGIAMLEAMGIKG